MDVTSVLEHAEADDRRTLMTSVTVVFLVISWLSVFSRTYVRGFIIHSFGWDDAIMLLAAITYTLFAAFYFLLIKWIFSNPHVLLQGFDFLKKALAYALATFAIHTACMMLIKISMAIFYLRIIVSRWQRITVYVTVGISTLYGIFFFFMTLFQCGLPKDYIRNNLAGNCLVSSQAQFTVSIFAGVVNAVSDLILTVLPVSLIYKANIPLASKISACLILLLACTGSAASFVRTSYIRGLLSSEDIFDGGADITLWSAIEAGLCIAAASLATLRPLFARCISSPRRAASRDSQTLPMMTVNEILPDEDDLEASAGAGSAPLRSKRSTILGFHTSDNNTDYFSSRRRNRLSATPKILELEILSPSLPSEPSVTRKASIRNGKVEWKSPHVEPPSEQPRPAAQPAWKISRPPAAARSRSSSSAPIASYDTRLVRECYAKRPSLEELSEPPSEPPSPTMKRVGVGAWRAAEKQDAPGTRPASSH